jgi:phenylalanyl-tRNA synthetase beta chain
VKLSFNWLSDYVDLSGLTPEEVAEKLTMGAFEVEEIKRVGPDIQGDVLVGEILDIRKHPDADKIRITTIRVSETDEPRQIVCGAWNIEVGQRIPVAMPGAKVINRMDGKALLIKESKMRGEVSQGMLCSAPELGIAGSGEGILILDPQTSVGTNAKELLNIKQDAVLHVGTRSNRGDALCVLGLAREVAALFERPLREPQWKLQAESANEKSFDLQVADTEDCPFFTLRLITDLKIGPAPDWMVRRLEAIGMRSVNNVVDITNYVMHELGQPLHAYDIQQLQGRFLQTRRAQPGEKLTTIDDREREMSNEVLVIADKERAVGVAGVMGGKGSEITDATTSVALEAAAFNSARVRRSSRLLGLSSDSSQRFERGVDIGSVRKASDRAAFLMVEHCGGKLGPINSAGSDDVKLMNIPFRLSEVTRLCDIQVDAATTEKLLAPLGFKVARAANSGNGTGNATTLTIEVPSFRSKDVTREVDLVEEVVRLYGYDRVPESMPKRTIAPPRPDNVPAIIKRSLSASGLNEAWISSLIATADLNARGFVSAEDAGRDTVVNVLNPLSEEHQALRQSLLPGLLKAVAYNHDRGQHNVWLFEHGLTYHRDNSLPNDKFTTSTKEIQRAAGIITGSQDLSTWIDSPSGKKNSHSKDAEATEFFTLKGALENLFDQLSIARTQVQYVAAESIPGWFHPSRACKIVFANNSRDKRQQQAPTDIGWLGEVHPAVADAYGLKSSAAAFELNIEALRKFIGSTAFQDIYNTPVVLRDLTVDLPIAVAQAPVSQLIWQYSGKLLRHVELVSVFDLSGDKRSLSYRLTFQHPEQTLTAEQVEDVMKKIRMQLTQQLSAEFRT